MKDKLKKQLKDERKTRIKILRDNLTTSKNTITALERQLSKQRKELESSNELVKEAEQKVEGSAQKFLKEIRSLKKQKQAIIEMHQKMLESDFITEASTENQSLQESRDKIDSIHMAMLESGLLTPKSLNLLDGLTKDSVALLTWKERKTLLHGLNFTNQIREVPSILASSPREVVKAIRIVSKLPSSQGAIIKNQLSKYPLGKDDPSWVKFEIEQQTTTTGSPGIPQIQGKIVGGIIKGPEKYDEEVRKQIEKIIGLTENELVELVSKAFSPLDGRAAYFLGLLSTDGHIASEENRIELSVHKSNRDILLSLRSYLGITNDILDHGDNNKRLVFKSQSIITRLKELGMSDQKEKHQVYKSIPAAHIFDFIRGMVDGDGSLLPEESKLQMYTPSPSLAVWIAKQFKKELKKDIGIYDNKNIKMVVVSGDDAKRLVSKIYSRKPVIASKKKDADKF